MIDIFQSIESEVRSYCRDFTDIFISAKDSTIVGESGGNYIDFFAGAGSLNYGHNNAYIKEKLVDYILKDGITQGLDLKTEAKRYFLQSLNDYILSPRAFEYKVQFCGSTGTDAVEASLKLAKKIKGRQGIFAFMGSYHGMTLGSMSVTSNIQKRVKDSPISGVTFIPFKTNGTYSFDSITYIESILNDDHSGIEKPAAIIFETIQAEGGINVASSGWLVRLRNLCDIHDIILICDDIQVGCGRTGSFFSFELSKIVPDIVILSKSISGLGLPMSIVLLKKELDIWKPGEHTGTFRGCQFSFVAGAAALEYRNIIDLDSRTKEKGEFIQQYLLNIELVKTEIITIRGQGMIWGIDLTKINRPGLARQVSKRCFEKKLIIEVTGRNDMVLKIMPPLTIDKMLLLQGLEIINDSLSNCIGMDSL